MNIRNGIKMVRCSNCKNLCLPKLKKIKTVEYIDENNKKQLVNPFSLGKTNPPLNCLAGKLFRVYYRKTETEDYNTPWVTFFEYARCDRKCNAYELIPEPHKGEFT